MAILIGMDAGDGVGWNETDTVGPKVDAMCTVQLPDASVDQIAAAGVPCAVDEFVQQAVRRKLPAG